MAYKNLDSQREYQRLWNRNRRIRWLADNGPCTDCGTWEELEVDHENAKEKITHKVWSWSELRRNQELSKCVVRCHDCHAAKRIVNREYAYGENHGNAQLTNNQVIDIRRRVASGERQVDLAKEFGVKKNTICDIINGRTWKTV